MQKSDPPKKKLQPVRPKEPIQPKKPTARDSARVRRVTGNIPASSVKRAKEKAEPIPEIPSSISLTAELNAFVDHPISIEPRLKKMAAAEMLQKLANVCVSLQPELDGQEIRFSDGKVLSGDREIGGFAAGSGRVSVSIPMRSLGYTLDNLPLPAIEMKFDVSKSELGGYSLANAIATSESIELTGSLLAGRRRVGLAFLNRQNQVKYRAPLRE